MFVSLMLFSGCSGNKKSSLSIPLETYKLDNGLTIILNKDKSDPITALTILYRVGSAREIPGKTGFAHLFEHMMSRQTENIGDNQSWKYITEAGGRYNGGTSNDYTMYYGVVPRNALELLLYIESEQMGYMVNAVTPKSLALEQNIVMNEIRYRYTNRAYGYTFIVLLKNLYPEGHPYSWDVIGEIKDVANATVEDVKAFHRKYYVPNNATLVASGDFEVEEVKTMIEKYFGEIPAGEELKDPVPMDITLSETKKLYHEDNFARAPMLNMVFPTTKQYTKDAYALEVLAQLLRQEKKSPLYKVLVKEKMLASNVRVWNLPQELTGRFQIMIYANPSTSLNNVEKAVFEAFARFETDGFTEKDLESAKAGLETNLYNSLSSVYVKSYTLAMFGEFAGSPDFMLKELKMMQYLTMDDIWDVYNRYIKGKNYVATSFVPKGQTNLLAEGSVNAGIVEEDITNLTRMEVPDTGEEEIEKTPSRIDRSVAPVPGPDPSVKIPLIWQSEAGNGLKIYGIEQHELPMVTYSIVIRGGHMLDDLSKTGVARLTAQMMSEGTKNRTPEELEEEIQLLGASINIVGGEEQISVSVNTLSHNFEKTLALVEEMLLEPRWDETQFLLNKTRTLNTIKTRLANPDYLAEVTLRKLNLGADNILSTDVNGTLESVEAISIDDLKAFYEKNLSPSVSYFLVAGDIDKGRVENALAGLNKRWAARKVDMPALRFPLAPVNPSVHFVDVPGAKQSLIKLSFLALKRNDPDFYKAVVANYMLGESTTGRFFMVLREEKGFTYDTGSNFDGMLNYGTFTAYAYVQNDATLESVKLFRDIMANYRDSVTQETVDITRGSLLKANTRRFETIDDKLEMLNTIAFYGLPTDYIRREDDYLRGLTIAQVNETVQKYINPMKMYYVVVGDAKTQMKGLINAGLGEPVAEK